MTRLSDIPVKLASPSFQASALPLLYEIQHALETLAAGGEEHAIDLMAIPFGPGDEEKLLAVLGEGEVQATINTLGISRIWESAFPGVWLVDHRDPDGRRIAFQVQVTRMPDILQTSQADLVDAGQDLRQRLAELESLRKP